MHVFHWHIRTLPQRSSAATSAPVRHVRGLALTSKPMEFQTITRDRVAALLREHGITPTHQRIEIAYTLFERGGHFSADQVLAIVNARHAETSKATVYNTLKLFLERKLIREVVVDPSRVFYDANTRPHHHFYNVVTGELTDIPAEAIRVDELPPLAAGSGGDGVDVVIRTRPASAERRGAPLAIIRALPRAHRWRSSAGRAGHS